MPESGPGLEARVPELGDSAWALAALSVALEKGLVRALEEDGDPAALVRRTGLPQPLAALELLGELGELAPELVRVAAAEAEGDSAFHAVDGTGRTGAGTRGRWERTS